MSLENSGFQWKCESHDCGVKGRPHKITISMLRMDLHVLKYMPKRISLCYFSFALPHFKGVVPGDDDLPRRLGDRAGPCQGPGHAQEEILVWQDAQAFPRF